MRLVLEFLDPSLEPQHLRLRKSKLFLSSVVLELADLLTKSVAVFVQSVDELVQVFDFAEQFLCVRFLTLKLADFCHL